MNEFDKEIFDCISDQIITTETSDSYFDLVEDHYPLGLNRIKWSSVHGHLELMLFKNEDDFEKIYQFLIEISGNYHIAKNDEVVVWGDGAIDNAYTMRFDNFLNIYKLFFCLPQHTYVWIKKIKKIINYTFEDELFFG